MTSSGSTSSAKAVKPRRSRKEALQPTELLYHQVHAGVVNGRGRLVRHNVEQYFVELIKGIWSGAFHCQHANKSVLD
jgi:hypothetical protein